MRLSKQYEWRRAAPTLLILAVNLAAVLLFWWGMTGSFPQLKATLENKSVWQFLLAGLTLLIAVYLASGSEKSKHFHP